MQVRRSQNVGPALESVTDMPPGMPGACMSAPNKNVVKELLAAWSGRDVERACACIGEVCNGGGPSGLRRELNAWFAAFPDSTITVEDMINEGARIATRTTFRGTHKGELMGIPATGRTIEIEACHFFRCVGGRVVERHGNIDRVELFRQLGLEPSLIAGLVVSV